MTGQPAYTDADVQAATDAVAHKEILDPPFRALSGLMSYPEVEAVTRAVLDAVAPAIAARAQAAILREIADDYAQVDDSYLSDRADEIEAGR